MVEIDKDFCHKVDIDISNGIQCDSDDNFDVLQCYDVVMSALTFMSNELDIYSKQPNVPECVFLVIDYTK
jgi:hypothetical protein